MAEFPDWLPPLVKLADSGGDVSRYYDALYQWYMHDLIYNPPEFEGHTIQTIADPMKDGMEHGFWHILEGEYEENLSYHLMRHERIRWVKPIIKAAGSSRIHIWKKPWKRSLVRPHIALLDFSYIVVLEQHSKFVKLITGYPIENPHRREKKRKEWQKFR